ncbi:MAG: EF-P beta-lysylation protein EpmB [Mariniblastus sp.]
MPILTSQSDFVRAGSGTWQQQMKWAIRDIDSLKQRLKLPLGDEKSITGSANAAGQFPVFVPLPLLVRMEPGNPNDPLLRQVLPTAEEEESPAHYSIDPLAESGATLQPGLLQKYDGRVLMIATGACAVHCRYCFRRHFPYQESPSSPSQWAPAIEQIANDDSIEEVILSGGDPLTLVDSQLSRLVEQLNSIPHLKRLRVHTRLPIMIPQRVTAELLEIFTRSPLHSIVVIHCNHANEIDECVAESIAKLSNAGVTMLNQTVLLRGINDNGPTLIELSKRLLDCRVLPYYLHQLDPVIGVSHFEVTRERGEELIAQMRAALPGYAVPRYVKELAGEANKTVWA